MGAGYYDVYGKRIDDSESKDSPATYSSVQELETSSQPPVAPPISAPPKPYATSGPTSSGYSTTTDGLSTYTYSSVPESVPSAPPPAQAPAPAQAPPPKAKAPTLDDDIDAMLAANGGRISSRGMRNLERTAATRAKQQTEAKRQAIMSKVPKTKTKDSEGGDLTFAARDDEKLSGKKLVSKYEGEDTSFAWRPVHEAGMARKWGLDKDSPEFAQKLDEFRKGDSVTTRYDTTPEAREKSRLKERGGGKVKTTHDQKPYNNTESHGWVMDPSSGNVHTFDFSNIETTADGKKRNPHHSSPLAGGKVAGAGALKIKDGHIANVDDGSGHYRPEGEYTWQAVKEMDKRGLLQHDADQYDEQKYGSGPGKLSSTVSLGGFDKDDPRQQKGWLEHEEGIYKGELTMPYQAFLQTRGNERQARAKVSMQDELKQKTPTVGEDAGSKAWRKENKRASQLPPPSIAPPQVSAPSASGGGDLAYTVDASGGRTYSQVGGNTTYSVPAPHSSAYSEVPSTGSYEDYKDDDAPGDRTYSQVDGNTTYSVPAPQSSAYSEVPSTGSYEEYKDEEDESDDEESDLSADEIEELKRNTYTYGG